ncbi:helix-turn-helix domain-containing protein [Aquimarina litoralis]|uniref:helix-turn-helix domain-containing protein n=1 Tax=Aquimarina litoralis TaxID=584605 RepID=UPI001C55F0DA|nr:helix-turn-helix domain-containing protein [Aquimarina litoralis]MBW1297685.1 helix-turn-helix domain-containing protein [Aquimarina litoralis]
MFRRIKKNCVFLGLVFCFTGIAQSINSTNQKSIFTQEKEIVLPLEIQQFILEEDSLRLISKFIRNTYKKNRDTLCAIKGYQLFLQRGISESNLKIQHSCLTRLGFIYYNLSEYQRSIEYYYQALKTAEIQENKKNVINNNSQLGSIFFDLGDLDNASIFYTNAKDLIKKSDTLYTPTKKIEKQLTIVLNIANVKTRLKRFEEALFEIENARLLLLKLNPEKKEKYTNAQLTMLLNKSVCELELKEYDSSEKTIAEGIELAKQYHFESFIGDFYVNKGLIHYKKKELQKAKEYFEKGLSIFEIHESKKFSNYLMANYNLAKCLFHLRKDKEALQLLESNFRQMNDISNVHNIDKMYELAITIAEKTKDTTKQLLLRKKLNKIQKIKTDDQLKARDIIHKNDFQTHKNQIKTIKDQNKKSITIKNIFISISIVLIAILVISFILHRRNTIANKRRFEQIILNLQSDHSQQKKKTEAAISESEVSIKDDQAIKILQKLEKLEDSDFFIQQDCNLYSTAKKIGTNTSYLSKTLNEYKKQSFVEYLNNLRINYVLNRLKNDSKFRAYTITAISEEIGYKSTNTFTKAFRKKTNLTPSYYIKQFIKEENKNTSNS